MPEHRRLHSVCRIHRATGSDGRIAQPQGELQSPKRHHGVGCSRRFHVCFLGVVGPDSCGSCFFFLSREIARFGISSGLRARVGELVAGFEARCTLRQQQFGVTMSQFELFFCFVRVACLLARGV